MSVEGLTEDPLSAVTSGTADIKLAFYSGDGSGGTELSVVIGGIVLSVVTGGVELSVDTKGIEELSGVMIGTDELSINCGIST